MMLLLAAGAIHAFFSWPVGGIWSNLLASVLWTPVGFIVGWFGALRHLHCQEPHCYRHGVVPVSGSVHKVCKTHALKYGHTHA